MVDSDVVGCCWIELPAGKYRMREDKTAGEVDSGYPSKVLTDGVCSGVGIGGPSETGCGRERTVKKHLPSPSRCLCVSTKWTWDGQTWSATQQKGSGRGLLHSGC